MAHMVELYRGEGELAETVSGFAAPTLLTGDAAVVVATPHRRRLIGDALRRAGVDLEGAIAEGRYREYDARDLLDGFIVDGMPDPDRFRGSVGRLVERLGAEHDELRVYGEMVALLWEHGELESTIALEGLWNDLAADFDFELLCGYPLSSFDDERTGALARICACHEMPTAA